jgi:hypothetical protein
MIQSRPTTNRGEIAWAFISTARASRRRRPELVSGPMPRWRGRAGCIQSRSNSEAWMLKRVQHDGGVSRPRLTLNQTPLNSQVAPFGVVRFNQVDLPLPVPVFQLLLSCDSVSHPVKRFGVNKADRTIISRKARRRTRPMLVQPRGEVGRYADVQGAALLAGENINTRLLHANIGNIQHCHAELVSASMPHCSSEIGCSHHVSAIEAWVLKRVQDDGCRGNVSA